MRSSTWRLDDLRNVILNLGFVGENLHTRQIFDCKKIFDQYPNASVSMTVTPPEGEPYPGTIERDGDLVIWDVRDSDLVAEGDGEIQIVFTQEPHIARSYNARTHICRSQVPTGSIPSGLDDYITRADQLLDQVEDTFPAGGTTGQVLAKKSDNDYDTEWVDQGGGTEDYDELENRPQIGGVTLTGNKTLHDLGAASEADVEAKYTKPETGIPASDLAAGVIPDPEDLIDDTAGSGDTNKVWSADKSHSLLTEINSKYEKPNTGIPASDMAEGVIPDISGKADKTVTDALQKNKAPVIIDSAEGNPIALTDGADGLPVEGMKIHFLPKQDTSGGDPSPSHVCPISGWSGVDVSRTGKNLLLLSTDDIVSTQKATNTASNGSASVTAIGTYARTMFHKKVRAGYTYTFRCKAVSTGNYNQFYIRNTQEWFLSGSYYGVYFTSTETEYTGTFTATSDDLYIAMYVTSSGTTGAMTISDVQLELGETATAYEPYTGASYPVTFGQTVYGGTLDAVQGVLTVDMAIVDMGAISWKYHSYGFMYNDDLPIKQHGVGTICSIYPVNGTSPKRITVNSYILRVYDSDYTDPTVFKSAVSGQTICYPLATPIEIHLDPITVQQTLIGDNTIWSDANGTIELDYRADTKLWISGHSTTVDSALSDTSENPVQNKVIKTALDGKEPLHNTTTVSGATPTITGVENTRYICGECSTLTITAPASGCIDVVFESGSTPTVLTVSSAKTGVTAIKWANGFDPTALEANTTYEINILDGEFGVVGSWT